MSSLPFPTRFRWKHMEEITYIGETSTKFLHCPHRLLLVPWINSWFILVLISSSNMFSKIAKRLFKGIYIIHNTQYCFSSCCALSCRLWLNMYCWDTVVELYIFIPQLTRLNCLYYNWRIFSTQHYSPIYYPNPLADLLTISFGDKVLRHKLN
jgi:hypothetical protein